MTVRKYCHKALEGHKLFIEEVVEDHNRKMKDYWRQRTASELREQATEAFNVGDYGKAAFLYAELRPDLSPAEVKKLKLSIKYSNDPSKSPKRQD